MIIIIGSFALHNSQTDCVTVANVFHYSLKGLLTYVHCYGLEEKAIVLLWEESKLLLLKMSKNIFVYSYPVPPVYALCQRLRRIKPELLLSLYMVPLIQSAEYPTTSRLVIKEIPW